MFSPRGIPADYRHMQGFGVNTYKWVNAAGRDRAGQVPLDPQAGRQELDRRPTPTPSRRTELGHAHAGPVRRDRARRLPRVGAAASRSWSDDEHPELDFDPLDDTKVWPEDDFPLRPVGRMVLDRNPTNFFAENEQIAFGTGVLVDGLDFSDDKMLVGRTFSYSRHPALPRRPELPPAAGQPGQERRGRAPTSATARWPTTSTATGENPHVNYEPSITGGLREARRTRRTTSRARSSRGG